MSGLVTATASPPYNHFRIAYYAIGSESEKVADRKLLILLVLILGA